MNAAGVVIPEVLVAAEDVERGKPDPSCYLLAAEQLGVPIESCVVFEDAEAGLAAAVASGVARWSSAAMCRPRPTVWSASATTPVRSLASKAQP